MFDISLYVVGLLECFGKAGVRDIAVVVKENPLDNKLEIIAMEAHALRCSDSLMPDNMTSLKLKADGKKPDLNALRVAVMMAGGSFSLEETANGGAGVRASLKLDAVEADLDQEMARAFSSFICTSPQCELSLEYHFGKRQSLLRLSEIKEALRGGEDSRLSLAREADSRIRVAMASLRKGGRD